MTSGNEWWRSAAIYQIYPRSFADSNGDGIGDLAGITERLPDVAELGVDAIWLSPFFTSPQHDAGYDVADYCDVDPLFGTLDDFDRMLTVAHELGLRVIVDLVPNHSSSEHIWFRAALAAAPGSPERARYIFRDGSGPDGSQPPNNWKSVFGGDAWERVTESDGTPGQWYLHIFDASQPDFDWTNPEVHELFENVLRFWLDRGVDGFRIDVAHGLVKADGLPDYTPPDEAGSMGGDEPDVPYWAQEGVHDVWRTWRTISDSYPGERVLTGEAWVTPITRMAKWVRPDELHQTFNFSYLETPFQAPALRDVVDRSLAAFGAVGAPSTWVLSNHDVIRHSSRLALTPPPPQGTGLGLDWPEQPDEVLSVRRARAATAFMLALPGSAYLYQGEELGLPEAIDLPDAAREDPTFFRTSGEMLGRDGCRVPLPWESDAPAYGFSPTGATWLPQPALWASFARDLQRGVPGSTLEFYRAALGLRTDHALGHGSLEWLETPADSALLFRNGPVTVLANTGVAGVPLPAGELLLSSSTLDGDTVPPDTTVWVLG